MCQQTTPEVYLIQGRLQFALLLSPYIRHRSCRFPGEKGSTCAGSFSGLAEHLLSDCSHSTDNLRNRNNQPEVPRSCHISQWQAPRQKTAAEYRSHRRDTECCKPRSDSPVLRRRKSSRRPTSTPAAISQRGIRGRKR